MFKSKSQKTERNHEPLRTTFRKLKFIFTSANLDFLLSFSKNGINDTVGPQALVPSVPVFGEYLSIRTISELLKERPNLSNRAYMSMAFRKYMSHIIDNQRVDRGLHYKIPMPPT